MVIYSTLTLYSRVFCNVERKNIWPAEFDLCWFIGNGYFFVFCVVWETTTSIDMCKKVQEISDQQVNSCFSEISVLIMISIFFLMSNGQFLAAILAVGILAYFKNLEYDSKTSFFIVMFFMPIVMTVVCILIYGRSIYDYSSDVSYFSALNIAWSREGFCDILGSILFMLSFFFFLGWLGKLGDEAGR